MSDAAVRIEVDVNAPADVVYELLTDPELFVRWIGISAELDPRPGGVFRFEIAPGEFCSGRYVEIERPHRVVFTWGYESNAMPLEPGSTTVAIDIASRGESCSVTLVHSGLDGPMRTMHAEGWNGFVPRLVAVAEGREPADDPSAPYQDGARPEIPLH